MTQIRVLALALLAAWAAALGACASTDTASAGSSGDAAYLYGLHAGQPMRDSPDTR